jgi:hypothetical protein
MTEGIDNAERYRGMGRDEIQQSARADYEARVAERRSVRPPSLGRIGIGEDDDDLYRELPAEEATDA